jgi:hypothetical protein
VVSAITGQMLVAPAMVKSTSAGPSASVVSRAAAR